MHLKRTKFVVAILPHFWTMDADAVHFVPLSFIQFFNSQKGNKICIIMIRLD